MAHSTEIQHCHKCQSDTEHVVVLVRKQSPFKNQENSQFKDFLTGFIKSSMLGAFVASMDEFERHLICSHCGEKRIEQ